MTKPVRHSPQKRVLFISYHFPPDASVGGLRIAKFAKYLRPFGWKSFAITLKDQYRHTLDFTLLKEVSDVKVFKTIQPPWLGDLYLWIMGIVRRHQGKGSPSATGTVTGIGHEGTLVPGENNRETVGRRVKRYWKSLVLVLPDGEWPWIIHASIKAIREIKREEIACIMSSSPPHSSHLVGVIAKSMTGVRWVADFRDPWTDAVLTRPFESQCALGNYLQRWLERRVIKSADAVLTTTRQLKEIFRNRYPEEPADKFIYLPNGYERAKDSCPEQEKDKTFTMTYTGNLYGGRNPEPVFSAVATLISGGLIGREEIRIRLVGDCQSIDGVDTEKIAQSYGLEEVVEILGRVPHAEALGYNQRSHLLLLIAPSHHYFCVPAKAYEYLASRIPILALTGKGATRDLIEETDAGACFSDSDVDGIARFILERFQAAHTSAPSRCSEKARQYEMEALAGRLDGVLSALIGQGRGGER